MDTQRVVIGLSGGVDSAVAAWLLREAGLEVHGAVLHLWQAQPALTSEDSITSAQEVAAALGISCRVLDLRARFHAEVVAPFVAAYAEGRTPNPCVVCNPGLKFAALREHADQLGAAWIATGHYARVEHPPGGPSRLLRALTRHNDQSYALYRLPQEILTRARFPLGELPDKALVRALAYEHGIPSAARSDSQDLCFMAGGDYRELLPPDALAPGPILDEAGEVLGEHQGLARYTVGQRGGLRIAAPHRLYVLRLDPERNALIVGPAERLLRTTCRLEAVTFCADAPPAPTFTADARIRYHAPLTPAEVTLTDATHATVAFAEPQRGIAPGQSVVFYAGEEVLGGGMIT